MTGPAARGSRLPYAGLPPHLHRFVADQCGAVTDVVDHASGFSPGAAATVTVSGGRRVFVKAVDGAVHDVTQGMHRREIAALRALAPLSVTVPEILAVYDEEPWVLFVTSHVEGSMPQLPWRPADVRALVHTLDALADVTAPLELPDARGEFAESLTGWRSFAEEGVVPHGLPPALSGSIAELARIEAGVTDVLSGPAVVHADVRGDNLLIDGGTAVLVDWPWASRGNPLCDSVLAAPSIAMQGGPAPGDFVVMTAAGRRADPDEVRALAVGIVGYFVDHGRRPAPVGLPTLRAFQRAQAEASYEWLLTLL